MDMAGGPEGRAGETRPAAHFREGGRGVATALSAADGFAYAANRVADGRRTWPGHDPVAELGPRALLRQTFGWQVFGLCLVVCHVLLVKTSVALFPVAMLVFAWIRIRTTLGGLALFFQVLLYQNIVISCFTGDMSHETFTVLQGTNFVCLAILAAPALARLWPPRHVFASPARPCP